jgi:hypothetical protein
MAKKVISATRRTVICSPYYNGFLDEMPLEIKEKISSENHNLYKFIFEKKL